MDLIISLLLYKLKLSAFIVRVVNSVHCPHNFPLYNIMQREFIRKMPALMHDPQENYNSWPS